MLVLLFVIQPEEALLKSSNSSRSVGISVLFQNVYKRQIIIFPDGTYHLSNTIIVCVDKHDSKRADQGKKRELFAAVKMHGG